MNWEHCRTQSANLFLSKVWTLKWKISLTLVLSSSLTHFCQLHIMSVVIVNFPFWFCPHFVGLKTLLSVYKVLVFGNLVTILAKLQQMLFIRQNTIMIYTGCQSVLILIFLLWVQKKQLSIWLFAQKLSDNGLRIQAQVKLTYVIRTQSQEVRYSSRFEPILIR